jgi:ADP-heptose:LPS heptosyltransferase
LDKFDRHKKKRDPEVDHISYEKWDGPKLPERILVIRLHAAGDLASTFPAVNGLKKLLPDCMIDLLTSRKLKELAGAAGIFQNIYTIDLPQYSLNDGVLKKLKQKAVVKTGTSKAVPLLKKNNYDIVIDLQHNSISKSIRKKTGAEYYSEFDRYSAKPHALRVLETIHRAGFGSVEYNFIKKNTDSLSEKAEGLLKKYGWDGTKKLIVLNPAGLWETRNWPLENYIELAGLLKQKDKDTVFITIGDDFINRKAAFFIKSLGEDFINLAGKTSLAEAFCILGYCYGIVTEDSGLFHMAWARGVPAVLLLGSTRNDWTNPAAGKVVCLNSEDLECGNCMSDICKYGDVRCLARYTPEVVVKVLSKVLAAGNSLNTSYGAVPTAGEGAGLIEGIKD